MSMLLLGGTSAYALAYSPVTAAQASPAAKAYVGLFKDNAVAVVDTGTNQVLSTIAGSGWPTRHRHYARQSVGVRQQRRSVDGERHRYQYAIR